MEKLRTADGVVIEDGSAVFVSGPWIAHVERVKYRDGVLMSDYAASRFSGGIVDPSICYSSSSAAAEAWHSRH